ncbi:selenium binding protein [Maribacter sp. ANRC-HE7]|uniref:Selenium binding protein n=1 Tax=Maribacter aquimaris TaxID=2737171 RepID=A0ABR7V364_9FLAO|nr:selenium binding protein [Maribacter aquimaris]MBD0777756.1 selenium binding protein [Maribacter aquimaris]
MYEDYSRQALPTRQYRELLGTALCVFNSNNSFVIENILRVNDETYSWYELIDKASGDLQPIIKKTITKNSNRKIASQFSRLVAKRNRIVHSFQITKNNEQVLASKDKGHKQFIIDKEYLLSFIKENETLSSILHDFRGF